MIQGISLDLMEFVEINILPRYTAFDRAHDLTHVSRVINRSVELARRVGADINMAYVALDVEKIHVFDKETEQIITN